MTLNIPELINLFFAFILIGIGIHILFSRHVKYTTNRIFAIFINFFAIIILRDTLDHNDKVTALLLLESVIYTIPPLIYLYTCSFIKNSKKFDRKCLLHFIPAISSLILNIMIVYFYGDVEFELLNSFTWVSVFVDLMTIISFCQFALYIGLSIDKLRQYKFWLEDHYSTTERIGFTWLNRFIAGIFILFTCGFLLFNLADFLPALTYFNINNLEYFVELWFYTIMNGFMVWASLYCLLTPDIFNCDFTFENSIDDDNALQDLSSNNKPKIEQNKKQVNNGAVNKYSDFTQDKQLIAEQLAKLQKVMQNDKPYLDASLGLKDLAEKVELPQRTLSLILNQELNLSFYNYVNYYRIEEVKFRLSLDENRNAKLEGVAMDSGFRSSSTFNRLFKQHTKVTPQAYREQQLASTLIPS